MIALKWTAGVVALSVLGACAQKIETQPVTAELAPMEFRTPVVGDTYRWAEGKNEKISKVTSVSNGNQTVEDSLGCRYVQDFGFSPSHNWSNCVPFTDGKQVFEKTGEIYPLNVGSSVSYSIDGENVEGASWTNSRNCTVEGKARVTVPAGTFDTYHVACSGKFTDYDFYMSPELGVEVMNRRYRKRQGETRIQKLISFEPGSGTV